VRVEGGTGYDAAAEVRSGAVRAWGACPTPCGLLFPAGASEKGMDLCCGVVEMCCPWSNGKS
jgi:hypothetical protein